MTVVVMVKRRGPLLLEGEFQLVDGDGQPLARAEGTRVALCRCGGSRSQPICDGSHHRLNFEGEPHAPPPEGK